ncbi:MAG: SusC/RagA family TonB-linked outer membrane protein [Adhaeribacter sp.]
MKRPILLIILCLLAGLPALAQQRIITGVVSDQHGPLPGATILEKDMPSNGVAAGVDGSFQLTLRGQSLKLVVKMIGFLAQEVSVAGKNTVNVTLAEDAKGLEEVVVVGYGTQTKVTQTGAVSQISGAEIRQNPSANIQNTLMGRLPGFTSMQRTGQPGQDAASFYIRGLSSFSGSSTPLVIVDDVEYSMPLSDIDPDQIESLTILKDASTTAIYGVKGANGVVLITTRRGQAGKPKISFRTETGLQSPTFPLKFLNAFQTATLRNQALANAGQQLEFTQEDLDHFRNGTDPYGHPDVNWTETIMRPHTTQMRNNLNISGGTEKVKYFLSVGNLWQNGIMKDFSTKESDFNSNYYYKRYTFRSNLDVKATKTLTIGVDLTGYMGEQNGPWLRGTANNPFFELNDYKRLPAYAYPIYNPDGSYGGNNSGLLANLAWNIVGRMRHLGYQRSYENGIMSNINLKQDLSHWLPGLSLRGLLAYNNANSYSRNLTRGSFPSFVYDPEDESYTVFDPATTRMPIMAVAYSAGSMNKRTTMQGSIHYDRTFADKHHVSALVLTNMYTRIPGSSEPERYRGYTMRVGYDFRKKYLLEVSSGYNGTDRFQSGNRYGFFPAASAGWNIAEENFFRDHVRFVDLFKLRGSYGLVGSDDIGGYQYIYEQIYSRSTGAYSMGETAGSTTANLASVSEGTMENLNVSWEKERSANMGLDLNMFSGKLKMTGDYFDRYRFDILRTRNAPVYSGMNFPPVNMAKVQIRGFEVEATYRNRVGKMNYWINGNVSVARNKILEMDEAAPNFPLQAQTGGSLGQMAGYLFDGFYQSEADIDNSAKPVPAVKPGDLKYKDMNGDKVINEADKVLLPYSNYPPKIYGLNLGLDYKGFNLSVSFQASTEFNFRAISTAIVPFVNNPRPIHLDTWTPENPDAALPRVLPNWVGTVNDPNTYVSDFWNKRGDFIRLRTAELGYRLPAAWTNRVRLESLRFYANGNNLATWMLLTDKDFYNLDPESPSGSAIMSYPQQKVVNFGVHVTF